LKKLHGQIPRKIWERILGIEARRLWNELTNTRNELTNTRNELTNTRNELTNTRNELTKTQQRQNRIHPYVAEALSLVAPVHQNLRKFSSKNDTGSSIFTEFGSDKDTKHSYGHVYIELLEKFAKPRILEIGVGSINLNKYSYAGLPAGGALKAFRKRFNEAAIIGVDIDPESIEIIRAEGFEGFVVDQTSDESLTRSMNILNELDPFDLILDDGFHDPHANVRTLKKFFSLLSDDGTYVIEDVHESLIDFWKTISIHLPGKVEILDMRELRPGVDDNILILITK
jgi:hypothetical protein